MERRVISRNSSAFMAEGDSLAERVAHRCETYVKVAEPRCFALSASVNLWVADYYRVTLGEIVIAGCA
jgi:hypothetical protein